MSRAPTLLLMLFLFFSGFNFAEAQDLDISSIPDRPDVSKWNVFSSSKISVGISDGVMYYLGYDLIYQNPNDPKVYVRQIRVLVPFVVIKSLGDLDKLADVAITYVTDGAEKELLKEYLVNSDPILEIRWREKDDLERDTSILDGENQVWFLDSFGTWVYGRGLTIDTLWLSEVFKELDNELIIVGRKYSLGKDVYHAHEVPHAYIVVAVKVSKGAK